MNLHEIRSVMGEAGTQVAFNGATNKYRYVCAPKSTSLRAGRYAGSAANERGVILTGTITGATREEALKQDPFVPEEQGGVGESYLPDYLIGNAATAREALQLLGDAIFEHGHSGPEIYMVADTNEAWYVEVYTGHEWAAALSGVTAVRIDETVKLGANSLAGIRPEASANGMVLADLFAAVGGQDPAGAISPAEFERIDIVDGKALLGVAVWTNSEVKAESEGWGVAMDGVIEVPAPGKSGFYILKSKEVKIK